MPVAPAVLGVVSIESTLCFLGETTLYFPADPVVSRPGIIFCFVPWSIFGLTTLCCLGIVWAGVGTWLCCSVCVETYWRVAGAYEGVVIGASVRLSGSGSVGGWRIGPDEIQFKISITEE